MDGMKRKSSSVEKRWEDTVLLPVFFMMEEPK